MTTTKHPYEKIGSTLGDKFAISDIMKIFTVPSSSKEAQSQAASSDLNLDDVFVKHTPKTALVEKTVEATDAVDDPEPYRTQSDEYMRQNKYTLELINKALEHVRVYDSKDTAVKLMGKAYAYCPSIRNKFNLSVANKSLRAAIKAESWKKSKKKFKHIREGTISNNMETFFEKITEAVIAIQVDIDKNNKTFFRNIQKNYHSDLPVSLPESKGYTLATSPVIIMAQGEIDKTRKLQHLEHGTFLLEGANLIGINTDKHPKKYVEKAQQVASKKGVTIYLNPLSRPSSNIRWFLILDFQCNVKFASFPEFLDIPDEVLDLSYDGLARKSQQMVDNERALKNTRLRSLRAQFFSDNATIISDIKAIQIQIENMLFERKQINLEFQGLTTLDEQKGGLDLRFRNRLYAWSMQFRDVMLEEGKSYPEANVLALQQRLEANTLFYEAEDIRIAQKKYQERLRFLQHMLEANKQSFAEKMGLVSSTKIIDLET